MCQGYLLYFLTKNESSYYRLISSIRNLRVNCQPATCLMDFEQALHNSFVSHFPHSEVAGCVFHLGQSIWRKICALGESHRYNTDDSFQVKIKCFCALAFLPIEDVVNGFLDLSDDEDIPTEFLVYFETTYIGTVRGRGYRQRRETPQFPIELWNVRERVLNDLPRSNNAVEGFHNALQSSITSTHPNFWKLCNSLKKEEGLCQTKMAHIRRGDSKSKKKTYQVIDARLKNLVENYEHENCLDFLRAIPRNLK